MKAICHKVKKDCRCSCGKTIKQGDNGFHFRRNSKFWSASPRCSVECLNELVNRSKRITKRQYSKVANDGGKAGQSGSYLTGRVIRGTNNLA